MTHTVKLSVVSEQGKEAIVAVMGPDQFFGEACLAGQRQRLTTATALTDCSVVRLEKEAILGLLHDDPGFADVFITHILERAIRVEADLVDQLFNSSEKRLARTLLLLANFGKETPPETIIPGGLRYIEHSSCKSVRLRTDVNAARYYIQIITE